MLSRALPFTLLLALAACAGGGGGGSDAHSGASGSAGRERAPDRATDRATEGATEGAPERASDRATDRVADTTHPADTTRRRPLKSGVTDTNFRSRTDSLRIKPPERRPLPPPLDRPLGVPPADSSPPKKPDTTRGRE
jgi:hypothetical protein